MKKKVLYLLLPIILLLLTGCSKNNSNNINNMPQQNTNTEQNNQTNNNQTAVVQRIAVPLNNINITNATSTPIIENDITSNINTINETNLPATNITSETNNFSTETELSSFSTKILTSDPNRNNNIQLTCNTLNEHIIKANETFSFTNLIGKSTSNKGYKEANIIAADGDTTKGLGGGNCQVSSTLYNAVAAIPELEVIERHNHGAEVYYVPLGKDAAVAYGSVDFKFKNTLNCDIKIYASTDDKNISIRICKIRQ